MNTFESVLPEALLLGVPRARWLLIQEDCSASTADQLVARLFELTLASREAVVLEMACARADYWGALRLHDAIRFLGTPVIGFVNGSIGLEALVVLQACATRIATPASDFLLQPPGKSDLEIPLTLWASKEHVLGKMEDHRCTREEMRQRVEDLLVARIGDASPQIREITDGSRIFLSAGDALSERLVDVLTGCGGAVSMREQES